MSLINKLKNYLGLSDDADDADVVISTKELKAKADTVEKLQSDLDEANATIAELKAEQAEHKQDTDEQIDEMLENAVKQYKIKASAKDQFKEQYADNPDGLKATLDSIPGKKPGEEITNSGKTGKRKSHMGGSLNSTVAKDFNVN